MTISSLSPNATGASCSIVVRSGAPIRMVGLDQTSRVLLSHGDAAALRQDGGDFARWAADCADAWISFLARAFPNRPKGATNARVAVDTDLDRFHELFMTRLSSPAEDEP